MILIQAVTHFTACSYYILGLKKSPKTKFRV